MSTSELQFLLDMGVKEAQLSEMSLSALQVKNPDMLDQLEEQARGSSDEEPQEVASPVKASRPAKTEQPVQQEVILPPGFLQGDEAHPIAIAVALKGRYGDEWVEWLPETLWKAIRQDLGSISEISQNKIMALSVALKTDAPWQNWTTFENVGVAFNGNIPHFGQMQPLSPSETVFTIATLKKLHPEFELSNEVLGYIAAVCLHSGIVHAPAKWFGKAQQPINEQNKQPELVPKIKAAWAKVKSVDLAEVELSDSNPIDVHIAKLWAIQDYLRGKQASLKETSHGRNG